MRPSPPAPADEPPPDEPSSPAPDGPRHGGRRGWRGWRPAFLAVPAERRRRGDLIVAAVIVVVAVLGTVLVLRSGDGASTTLRTAEPPLTAPPPASGPPTALAEVWRAPSPATPTPLVVGPAVVTVGPTEDGGGRVAGHDPRTGAVAWEYTRPEAPCTAAAAFGDALAVFRTDGPLGPWCSDVAALEPATGERGPARNGDLRDGTRLLGDRRHVVATGADYLEVWRDDLVLTSEIGAVPSPVQPPSQQPRAVCRNGSVTAGDDRVAVIQRCPGEDSDRLTVYDADPDSAEKPDERVTTLTGVRGARVVATTGDRTAYAAPDGTLRVVDGGGATVATVPLGPAAGPTADPPGLAATTRAVGPVRLWWTGTATVALDTSDLVPRWTRPGTLGTGTLAPGTDRAPAVLVPVPTGYEVLDATTGAPRGPAVPVARGPVRGPLDVATLGATVVEQRGDTVVALAPPGR